jgi:hypothetical protein
MILINRCGTKHSNPSQNVLVYIYYFFMNGDRTIYHEQIYKQNNLYKLSS